MDLPINYEQAHYTVRRAARQEYVRRQQGRCFHCGASLAGVPDEKLLAKPVNERLFPPGFFDYPVHLHHSHETGLTLGAVHNHCNAVLWQYYGE